MALNRKYKQKKRVHEHENIYDITKDRVHIFDTYKYCSIYKKYHINFISFTYEIWIYNHIESLKLKKKNKHFHIYCYCHNYYIS